MPGEEYPHVSPGGSQWERVSDAEAAVVFNQRTWGTLQLPAQQVVWQVIITEGHSNWSKNCKNGICFLPSADRILWSSFCSHLPTVSSWLSFFDWTHKCLDVYFLGVKCALINTEGGFSGRYRVFVHMQDCVYEIIRMYEINVCLIAHDKLAVIYIYIC